MDQSKLSDAKKQKIMCKERGRERTAVERYLAQCMDYVLKEEHLEYFPRGLHIVQRIFNQYVFDYLNGIPCILTSSYGERYSFAFLCIQPNPFYAPILERFDEARHEYQIKRSWL